jgi:UDP-N-acetylglucosamine 2-epimerase (non-hydrolysing)
MNRLSVTVVVGTRPEAIKMAPVYLALRSSEQVQTRMVVSGQHAELVDQVLSVFGIQPDLNLRLMRENQGLADLASRAIAAMSGVLSQWKPDVVLVHGDTTTCLASGLAAFYQHIPIGHVEAGLRTYDFDAPWPEEMNRRLVDPICRWCFAPTARAAANLRSEGIPESHIQVTGNTVIDALLMARDMVNRTRPNIAGLPKASLNGLRTVLVTGHRRESFGAPIEQMCLALRDIVREFQDVAVIYPIHPNPNVEGPVRRILEGTDRILLIPPVDYLELVYLMQQSCLVITDSGGIQEEAPSFGKPVLVTRRVTERPEAAESGCAKLVGTDREAIVREARSLLANHDAYARVAKIQNPYGDGRASRRILQILLDRTRGEETTMSPASSSLE